MYAIVMDTIGELKLRPDRESERADETLFGRLLKIIDQVGDWYYVETDYRYKGYIRREALLPGDKLALDWNDRARHIIDWNIVDLMEEPSYQSSSEKILTRGAIISLTGRESGDWVEISDPMGKKYWVRKDFVGERVEETFLKEEEFRERIVKRALDFLGSQYRWGGKSYLGIDCSGLTSLVYLLEGVRIYRDAEIREGFPLRQKPLEAIKKGDLLFWPGHVAIYLGEGEYIHSTGDSSGVVINSLDPKSPIFREDRSQVQMAGSIF